MFNKAQGHGRQEIASLSARNGRFADLQRLEIL